MNDIVDTAPPELVAVPADEIWFLVYDAVRPCPAYLSFSVDGVEHAAFLAFTTQKKAFDGRALWLPEGRVGAVAAREFEDWAHSKGWAIWLDVEVRADGLFFHRLEPACLSPGGKA